MCIRDRTKSRVANDLVVAEDGQEALDYLFGVGAHAGRDVTQQPALVLLDLKLPKVDGLDVLRRLKASLKLRVIAVVVLTTSAEDRDVQLAYELGANSYIVKPVSFDKFLQVAEQIELYWGLLNQPCT